MRRLLITSALLISLLWPASNWAATFVQGAICHADNVSSTTITCALGTTTLGNVIVAAGVGFYNSTADTTSTAFTDDKGNTYTEANTRQVNDQPTGQQGEIATAPVTTAGATTITQTFVSGATPTYKTMCVLEYSGVDPNSPQDVSTSQWQNSPGTATDAVGSSLITTTADNEMVVGALFHTNSAISTMTAGTGFTSRVSTSGATTLSAVCEEVVKTTAGFITATATSNVGGDDTIGFALALKNAVGSSSFQAPSGFLSIITGK